MKINDKSQTYLVLAGIIFAFYYFIILPAKKSLTDTLGLTDSADTLNVQKESIKKLSGFNVDFWRNNFYLPPAPINGRKKISGVFQIACFDYVKDLKKNFGFLSDNENGAISFFGRFKSKSELSFFSMIFEQQMKQPLLNFLRKGTNLLPENGLSDKDVNKIISYVNKLPTT